MSLQGRLGAYILAIHLPPLACAALLLPGHPLLFVGAELLLLASLAAGWRLMRRALEPLDYTRRFRDLLQDQHYANRMAPPAAGKPDELGELVASFNTMLAALHRERLMAGEQQGLLDRLLEATPSAVLVFDYDRAISLVNASAATLLGLEQAQGKRLADLRPPMSAPSADAREHERRRDLAAQLDALASGESRLLTDLDGRRYRAQRGHFYDRGFARDFLFVEELTAELEDSERATYAKLVRVLAHEVNNTVAATRSVLDSLLFYRNQLADSDAADFSTAIDAVRRRNVSLGEFIDRFTRVVKMPEPELRPTSLRAIVDDILWLKREACSARGVELRWVRCDEIEPIAMDGQLMEQALLNIVKNAIEAVQGRQARGVPGGHVHLALEARGAQAVLSVVDSAGLLGEVAPRRLFTPFFTTKPGGQGIGLMFVREVLNRHGFGYALETTGEGQTRFEIRFA
ncbi:PAS domain-containing sensor histidine kinase [Massilia sp. Mn16-1_5]|uniref:sensor histidine kinase n=1 Tax=Massilia sp. Mn16-1_5 TaxID=2079199 RepID=UPI00109ECEF9|nr:ATP-binding protein [Massilia sp. Mn16-1_5]THC46165.1 histidine kinase [Massilia sp. Mn16-1_5]